jgi:hypothetical protein
MNRRHPRSSGIAPRVPWLGAGLSFILGITGWASETPPDEASALFGTTELSVHIESTGGTAGQAGLPSELYGEVDAAPASGEQTTDFEGGGLQASTPTDEFLRSRIALSEAEPSGHAGLKRDEKAAPPVRNRPAADNPDEQLQLLIAESRSQVRLAGIELAEAGYYGPSEMEDEHANPSGGAASNVEVRVGDHGAYERVVFEWPEGIDYAWRSAANRWASHSAVRAGSISLGCETGSGNRWSKPGRRVAKSPIMWSCG